ncbi:M56 family metallopeptidase [Sinomicrobium sp. M5D2P17]
METFLIYTAKSAGFITLFYGCYRLFLHRETFFRWNRFFLLSGVLLSLVLPFWIITRTIEAVRMTSLPDENAENIVSDTIPREIDMWNMVFWIYISGVALFTVRLIVQLLSLRKCLSSCKRRKEGNIMIMETIREISPFSFFNFLVYNPGMHPDRKELEAILLHEKVHIRQLHSLDVILVHVFTVFQWCNPVVWLYQKAVVRNLEYLADRSAAGTDKKDKKDYQLLLLRQTTVYKEHMALTNTFFNSSIKNRIVMLHTSHSNQKQLWKYGIVIPVLTLFLFAVNTREVAAQGENDKELNIDVSIDKNATDNYLEAKSKALKSSHGIELEFKRIKRNSLGEIIAISSTFKKGASTGSWAVSGDKSIKPFHFFVDSSDEFGYATIEKTEVYGLTVPASQVVEGINVRNTKNTPPPLYVIDGEVKDKDFDMNSVSPSSITAIHVLKGGNAKKKYGKDGVNGVIEITTMKE